MYFLKSYYLFAHIFHFIVKFSNQEIMKELSYDSNMQMRFCMINVKLEKKQSIRIGLER
jgi:hypothetical protein